MITALQRICLVRSAYLGKEGGRMGEPQMPLGLRPVSLPLPDC